MTGPCPAWTAGRRTAASDRPGNSDHGLGFRVSLVLPDNGGQASERPRECRVPTEPIVPRNTRTSRPQTRRESLGLENWFSLESGVLGSQARGYQGPAVVDARNLRLSSAGCGGAGQLSPDDRLYATGGHDGVIRFLDPATGKLRIALVNPELDLTALTWSPDSAYVAVGCTKGVVRIWNVAKGTLVIGPTSSSTNGISSLAWSPDGTPLAVARNGESAVILWDVREARQSAVLQEQADVNRSVNFLAWSADGKQLMATTDLAVRIWDVAGARLVRTLDPQIAKIQPDGRVPDARLRCRVVAGWQADCHVVLELESEFLRLNVQAGRCPE